MTKATLPHMHPLLREHYVYRAFDAEGQLLYVGCTKRLRARKSEHKSWSEWYPLAVRFRLSGPYNYDTGRRLEREAIDGEHPIWNADEPFRRRIEAMRTRIANRAFKRGRIETGTIEGGYAELHRAERILPPPPRTRPLTSFDVARAERIERIDRAREAA